MNDEFRHCASAVASFLERTLPLLTDQWWEQRVLANLTPPQLRNVAERRVNVLGQLDFAALLRIADRNWQDIATALAMPREGRTLIRELIAARNRWAHATGDGVPARDLYRDADTLERFLTLIGADPKTLAVAGGARERAFAALSSGGPTPASPEAARGPAASGPAPRGGTQGEPPADRAPAMPALKQADRIRAFVMEAYVQPARLAGAGGFSVRSGDVHRRMGLANALPAVCSAIGSTKFAALAAAGVVERTGPANSSTVVWRFAFEQD